VPLRDPDAEPADGVELRVGLHAGRDEPGAGAVRVVQQRLDHGRRGRVVGQPAQHRAVEFHQVDRRLDEQAQRQVAAAEAVEREAEAELGERPHPGDRAAGGQRRERRADLQDDVAGAASGVGEPGEELVVQRRRRRKRAGGKVQVQRQGRLVLPDGGEREPEVGLGELAVAARLREQRGDRAVAGSGQRFVRHDASGVEAVQRLEGEADRAWRLHDPIVAGRAAKRNRCQLMFTGAAPGVPATAQLFQC
jgi:hypothetical protein